MTFLLYVVVAVALAVLFVIVLAWIFYTLTGHDQIERNSTTVVVQGTESAVLGAAEATLIKMGYSNITHNPEGGVLIGTWWLLRLAPLRFVVRDRGDGSCDLTVSGAYRRAVHNVAKLVPAEYARLNPTSYSVAAGGAVSATMPDAPSPEPAAAPVVPAGWHQDPTGRHQMRYWDSTKWTEHVSNDGVLGLDAI